MALVGQKGRLPTSNHGVAYRLQRGQRPLKDVGRFHPGLRNKRVFTKARREGIRIAHESRSQVGVASFRVRDQIEVTNKLGMLNTTLIILLSSSRSL